MKKTSSFTLIALLFWLQGCGGFERLSVPQQSNDATKQSYVVKKDFELHAVHNQRFLIFTVRLKDAELIRDAEHFGLILFYSDRKDQRYKFGFSLPSGLYNGLSFDPKTQRSFVENRMILNDPTLAKTFERAKELSKTSALVYQQTDPREKIYAAPMHPQQLVGQQVHIEYKDDRRQPEWRIQIPISSELASSFQIDRKKNAPLYVALAIKPPNSEQVVHQHFASSAFRELDQDMGVGGARDQYRMNRLMQTPLDWEYWFKVVLE